MKIFTATVCFLLKDNQVNLAVKTRKIGKDRWNGYGGGTDDEDKDLVTTAVRELWEESEVWVAPESLRKMAILEFHNSPGEAGEFMAKVHIYVTHEWTGEPKPTKEMATPTWFPINDLPLDTMMPADREWLPRVLAGEKLLVWATYGPEQKYLIGEVIMKEVDNFE